MSHTTPDPTTGTVLTELVPRRARQVIYLAAAVGGLVLGLWQAAEGNWTLFAGGLFTSAQGLLAAGNITPPGAAPERLKDTPL